MAILFIFSFLAGVCTILSPCILPILPIVLAAGASKGRLRPLGVTVGLIVSFTFFTLSLTSIVQATGISANFLRQVAIALIFLFGLIMIFPTLSARFFLLFSPLAKLGERIQESGSNKGFTGGIILGFALGLLWTPCAGPILAAIVALIATQSVTFMTFGLALTYVTGAAIPLLLIAWGGGRVIQTSNFLTLHMERIRQFFGFITLLVAVAIALHWDVALGQKIASYVPAIVVEDNQLVHAELEKLQKEIQAADTTKRASRQLPGRYSQAPEFMGLTNWINSPPLSLKQLRGKVVLVDFWTYTCINCLRTLPYIEKWYEKYKDKGFVVIGIHTPEFEFEKETHNVFEAVTRLGITYPVAQDNNYSVWQAYHNHYWPAHYLINQDGEIVSTHFGEGDYDATEKEIEELLGTSQKIEQEKSAVVRPISPETYLGTARGSSYTSENRIMRDETTFYNYSKALAEDEVGLKGSWKVERESITSESDESFLDYNFLGRKVYLVLSGSSSQPLLVFLDGKKVREIHIDFSQKHDIVDASYGRHLLSLKVPKGVSAYAFTFGDE